MDDDVPPYEALNPSRNEIIEGLLACSLATDILIREASDEDAVSQSEYSIPRNFIREVAQCPASP